MPTQPVSLSVEQVKDLNDKVATLRHDINNHLSLILAATELIRHQPQTAERMAVTVSEQPPKITAALAKFTAELEAILGIAQS